MQFINTDYRKELKKVDLKQEEASGDLKQFMM